jgi:hypothetical protein
LEALVLHVILNEVVGYEQLDAEEDGLGILIDDGQLNYRPEKIIEAYYAYSLNKWSVLTLTTSSSRTPPTTLTAGRCHFTPCGFMRSFSNRLIAGPCLDQGQGVHSVQSQQS